MDQVVSWLFRDALAQAHEVMVTATGRQEGTDGRSHWHRTYGQGRKDDWLVAHSATSRSRCGSRSARLRRRPPTSPDRLQWQETQIVQS